MSSLPVELVHMIVGIVADSSVTSDLLACSSTCRQWNAASRPIIFRHITIKSESQLRPLAECLQEAEMKSWICHFRIDARGYRRSQQSWVLQVFDILHTYGPFPRIEKLDLFGFYETPEYGTHTDLFTTKLASLSSVTSLRILETALPHTLLRSYASSFPNLEALDILRSKTSIFGTYTPIENPDLALKSFTFVDDHSETDTEILRWLSTTKSKETLRILDIDYSTFRHRLRIHRFLTSLGSHITDLNLSSNIVNDDRVWTIESARVFTALRNLTVQTIPTSPSSKFLTWLPSPELLRSLRYETRRKHILVTSVWFSARCLEEVPLDRFPNLEEVVFDEGREREEDREGPKFPFWMTRLQKLHPELDKKGMFKHVYSPRYEIPLSWDRYARV